MFRPVLIAALLAAAAPAAAEYATYGTVDLNGLARDNSWPLNAPGLTNVMVCDVNGPDGFLAIRSGPLVNYPAVRKLKRLAVLIVDTKQQLNGWVYVVGAYRNTDSNGRSIPFKELPVTGWAHSDHLCDFLD